MITGKRLENDTSIITKDVIAKVGLELVPKFKQRLRGKKSAGNDVTRVVNQFLQEALKLVVYRWEKRINLNGPIYNIVFANRLEIEQ